jgi:hypothetical protein
VRLSRYAVVQLEGTTVRVPLDRFEVLPEDTEGRVVVHRDGRPLARGALTDAVVDPALSPVTGTVVAGLSPGELQLVAECWSVCARRALRSETDPARRTRLRAALGHARVLRALAGDVDSGAPTTRDFDSATALGLLTPVRRYTVSKALSPTRSPLDQQRALAEAVRERVDPAGDGLSPLRSRSAFAGMTMAAALILTGCTSTGSAGDRRCTDASGKVVDDDNCRRYGGGGTGGYFYRYGGSTYTDHGSQYLRGGTTSPPKGGHGFFGGSGGGG